MTEKEIQKQIIDYLRLRRIPATRHQCGAAHHRGGHINMGEAGWPDIIACLPDGRFLGIEVKRKEGKLRPAQSERITELLGNNAAIVVARSVEDVEKALTDASLPMEDR